MRTAEVGVGKRKAEGGPKFLSIDDIGRNSVNASFAGIPLDTIVCISYYSRSIATDHSHLLILIST